MEMFAIPVLEGLCSFTDIKEGRLDLGDIAMLADWCMWKSDNQYLAHEKR